MSEHGDAIRVFISYARRDLATADEMVADLERASFSVSIDRRDLPYGEQWQAELAELIRSADTVVWLVSRNSVQSKCCNWELGEVARLSKRLIPVRIPTSPPKSCRRCWAGSICCRLRASTGRSRIWLG